MSEHIKAENLPPGLRSRKAIFNASNQTLDQIMGLCHVEPGEPDKCLACWAYDLRLQRGKRSNSGKREQELRARWTKLRLLLAAVDPQQLDYLITEIGELFKGPEAELLAALDPQTLSRLLDHAEKGLR